MNDVVFESKYKGINIKIRVIQAPHHKWYGGYLMDSTKTLTEDDDFLSEEITYVGNDFFGEHYIGFDTGHCYNNHFDLEMTKKALYTFVNSYLVWRDRQNEKN
ncbi:hypothetical protein [Pseudostreptobacillus hongkongensis]|uniref:hypothetical protein n=1 Tax=Pseudostreptobacillus hongkongensis TaxID=1162717 RepID=UPI0012E3E549|nr:hypothetical protein [Pseudostreptobacillus hongkongensis]